MKKRAFFPALLLLLSARLYALSVGVIVPEPLKKILVADLSELWFDNVIFFEEIDGLDDDMSVAEMSVYGQRHEFDFLVYGFSESDGGKCSAELRLLNVGSRKTDKTFYAADSSDSIKRLSDTLASHIHDYLCDRFSIYRTEFTHFYKFDLTFSVGYWTYTSQKWTDLLLGVVASHVGLEFHPALDFRFGKNGSADFSLAFNAGYRFGRGIDDKYKALFHGMEYSLPVIVNWNPTAIHSLRLGLGPAFQMGFVDWTPLYEDEEVKKIYQWGITSFLQGRVFVSPIFGLSLGFGGTHYFVRDNVPEFTAEIGIVLTPYKKESAR